MKRTKGILCCICFLFLTGCISVQNGDKMGEAHMSQEIAELKTQETVTSTTSEMEIASQINIKNIPDIETNVTPETEITTLNNIENMPDTETEDQYSDIKAFWIDFRNAVLSDDPAEIKKYVKFPLKTRGDEDDDPIIEVDEDKFGEVFALYLAKAGELAGDVYRYHLDFIERNKTLECKGGDDYDNAESHINLARVEGDWAWADDMKFVKKDGKWLLAFIYINLSDEAYEKSEE